jgi:hypothetical protein
MYSKSRIDAPYAARPRRRGRLLPVSRLVRQHNRPPFFNSPPFNQLFQPTDVLEEVVTTKVFGGMIFDLEPLSSKGELRDSCLVFHLDCVGHAAPNNNIDMQTIERYLQSDRSGRILEMKCPRESVLEIGFRVKDWPKWHQGSYSFGHIHCINENVVPTIQFFSGW